ncbi:hypothetical protein [Streptomyces sp. NPDC086787]|uniref:hypothetical protein n=1 Tax=Streptomyces sp. NPDC086787 TaxID=3365759 RepID=UPI0037FAEA02
MTAGINTLTSPCAGTTIGATLLTTGTGVVVPVAVSAGGTITTAAVAALDVGPATLTVTCATTP